MEEKITIITTVNKGLDYLRECVDSVYSQTHENWEHIIIGDGAADDVADYLVSLSDERQQVIFSAPIGRAAALNLGIKHCSSELIAILDADDVAHPERLSIQREVISNLPNASVLASKCTSSEGKLTKYDNSIEVRKLKPNDFLIGSPICHSATLMRKSHITKVSGYDVSRKKLIDLNLWKDLMIAGHELYTHSMPLAYHRIHSDQSFEQKNRVSYLQEAFKIRVILIRELNINRFVLYKPLLVFVYGFVPIKIRMFLRRYMMNE